LLDIISNDATTAIELGELIEHLQTEVDFRDQASIRDCAPIFAKLYLNRTFLAKYILEVLKSGLKNFEAHNRYTPPSIVLASAPQFLVRANLWRATEQYEKLDLNVYGLPHDHNFDFLTLSYSGPGYGSKMYTYDYAAVRGMIGEKVKLQENGFLELQPGEMYLYRKNVDVHLQLPPRKDSITINIMANFKDGEFPNQYIFDIATNSISNILGGFSRQKHVFEIALSLNDPACNDVMKRISRKSKCEITRAFLSNRLNTNRDPLPLRR